MFRRIPLVVAVTLLLGVLGAFNMDALSHGVADDDKAFIERTAGTQLVPYIYLGASTW